MARTLAPYGGEDDSAVIEDAAAADAAEWCCGDWWWGCCCNTMFQIHLAFIFQPRYNYLFGFIGPTVKKLLQFNKELFVLIVKHHLADRYTHHRLVLRGLVQQQLLLNLLQVVSGRRGGGGRVDGKRIRHRVHLDNSSISTLFTECILHNGPMTCIKIDSATPNRQESSFKEVDLLVNQRNNNNLS